MKFSMQGCGLLTVGLLAATLSGCRSIPVPESPRGGDRASRNQDAGADGGAPYESRRERRREERGGGGGGNGEANGGGERTRSRRPRAEANGQPGAFDFYLLNLSWSPEFCATHGSSPECGNHLGFVLHGLWPQNGDGTYPENCSHAPGPASLGPLAGIVPTESLLEHEWTTHGTCTGLDPAAWEGAQKTAFTEVRIPAGFGSADGMLTPDAIVAQFAAANPGFPAGSIAVSCGNNRLTAIEVCLTKDLRPEACAGVRNCRANVVKITGK